MGFDESWSGVIETMRIGDYVEVDGKIEEIGPGSVYLEDCDLLAHSRSEPDTE